MPLISVEIPTLGEATLGLVLESIRNQTFQDYEVVVVDSSPNYIASDVCMCYDVKIIKASVSLLKARYLLHKNSSGEYSLVLDATRPLARKCLEVLSSQEKDMVIIAEKELGTSFWARAQQLDKRIIMQDKNIRKGLGELTGFLLPRVFDSKLLAKALEEVRMKVGKWIDFISGGDHYAIFYEASKFSRDIGIIRQPLILHYADDSIGKVLHKYYRYGRDLQILSHFYPESVSRRLRSISGIGWKGRINLLTLYIIRGAAYMMGRMESKLRYSLIM